MNLDATIKIDVNSDNIETEISIKALIDKIRESLKDRSINITQKYVYKLCIHGGWKMYPIHSMDDWESLLQMLETSSLILDLDNLSQLFTSNKLYNPNNITLLELSIIQQIEITKPGQNRNLRGDNGSAFSQYSVKDKYSILELILSKAQIFETIIENKNHRKELNLNCFCYALLQASKDTNNLRIKQNEWDLTFKQTCNDCLTRYVSIKDIKSYVEKYNLFINFTTFTKTDQKRNRKRDNIGYKDTAIITCNLGIFKQRSNMKHFFYNCQVPITKYFTQHIGDILKYSKKHNKTIE